MQDMNAAVNPYCNTITPAANQMPTWEATGKVRILNDRSQPTRVPFAKTHQANCLNLVIITPRLCRQ